MGPRAKQPTTSKITATVSGCNPDRTVFVERVQLVENTTEMACVRGLRHRVQPGSTLTLHYAGGGGMLSVVWVGQPRTERAGMIGLRWMQANEAAPMTSTTIADPTDGWDYAVPV